jgi:hypothetical protein
VRTSNPTYNSQILLQNIKQSQGYVCICGNACVQQMGSVTSYLNLNFVNSHGNIFSKTPNTENGRNAPNMQSWKRKHS